MPANNARGFPEAFAKVLEDPTRDSFRDLLRQHTGETANLDFKEEWPADEKLARHALALGNSGGGCIVIGVAERDDKSIDPVGLAVLKDKVDITKKLNPLVPETLMRNLYVDDFAYESSDYAALQGKRFQLITVVPDPQHIPFVAVKSNADSRIGAIYVRRGTESVESSHDELQRIINTRIDTGHSTAAAMKLEDHLDQLFVLQDRIPQSVPRQGILGLLPGGQFSRLMNYTSTKNPEYPVEDAAAFVRRMFEAKKRRIERELDL